MDAFVKDTLVRMGKAYQATLEHYAYPKILVGPEGQEVPLQAWSATQVRKALDGMHELVCLALEKSG